MNNGQPPYGGPSAWGQPGSGQQWTASQPVTNPPPVTGQQPAVGQQPVQPNPYQQGYGMQQPYQQPTYGTSPTYQPQQHPQQQVYPQQTWQPYQQPYQQPGYQQPYGQQAGGYPPYQQGQNAAPQYDPQGQPVNPYQGFGQGYTGIRTQPATGKFHVPYDVVAKVVVFGILPVLFILSMVLGGAALKWVFLAAAIVGIVMLWMRDVVSPNMKLMLTLICGAAAVVALVGALNGPVQDQKQPPSPGSQQGSTNQASGHGSNVLITTAPPPATPTPSPSPDPYGVDDPAQEVVESFFYHWSQNNDEGMLSLCAPSWLGQYADTEAANKALFGLRSNRIPQDGYMVQGITGSPDDTYRVATVKAAIDKQNGRTNFDVYSFKINLEKADGLWYVNPTSLKSYEAEVSTPTPAGANATATQPPLATGFPDMTLYYNSDGGARYHVESDCTEVHKKYLPMATFFFYQLGEDPYSELDPCNVCGAPIPED